MVELIYSLNKNKMRILRKEFCVIIKFLIKVQ